MRVRPFVIGAVAVATLAVSCGSPFGPDFGEDIDVALDAAMFDAGAPVRVTIANRSDDRAYYNFCQSAPQRREGTKWVTVEPLVICAAAFGELGPGESTEGTLAAPSPGTYRIRVAIRETSRGPTTYVFTSAFQVRGN